MYCKVCGWKRDEALKAVVQERRTDMGLVCLIVGHKWHKLPDGEEGCSCSRCGKNNVAWVVKHNWGPGQPIIDARMKRLARIKHRCTCAWCGDYHDDRHCFELNENCTIRCTECGYETPWHDFANGVCTNCGEDESAFYRRLIFSGDVCLSDNEETPCKDALLSGNFQSMRYSDHLQKTADLAEVVMSYKPWGSEDSKGHELYVYLKERDALEACVCRLGELAKRSGDEAADADNALYQIALAGPESFRIYAWRGISNPTLKYDPALAGIAEASKIEAERSRKNYEAWERFIESDNY